MKHPSEAHPLDFYEFLLLVPLKKVYLAKKATRQTELIEFSNLLIDKFAIHSSSFFHLSKGIIELKKSGEEVKMTGYDLFTVNSTFRTIMENYSTFNNLFVEPKTKSETEFRFLLWKIDGLFDKERFDILEDDFEGAKEILENDEIVLSETIDRLENNSFYKSLERDQLDKVYKPNKKRVNWRFKIDSDLKITPLTITDLIKHTCRTKGFVNNYRYSSTHTHTNYLAIDHFRQTRGIPISDKYTDPIEKLAIFITCLMICDICEIDLNAGNAFETLPESIKAYIKGINRAIKNE